MVWRRDLHENKQLLVQDDVWPDMWKNMSDAAKKKTKHEWAIEKPKLDNGIHFIEPENKKFRFTMKAALRKLEVPMPAAIPAKNQ